MTEILCCVSGSYATNCYILRDTATGEAAAIDCAVFDDGYRAFLRENGIEKLKYIILTHGHFDHICGVKKLHDALGGKIAIYETEADCLYNEERNLNDAVHFSDFSPCRADILLNDGDTLPFGGEEIKVMHTPGHTSGGVCLFYKDALFCGDTLMRLSMGRADLPTGSIRQLFASLRALGEIKEEYAVYPGHGEFSSLSEEKEKNRYLGQRNT